jgi:hypothetical protein
MIIILKFLRKYLYYKLIKPLKLIDMPKSNPKHAKRALKLSQDSDDLLTKRKSSKGIGRKCSIKNCKDTSIHSLSLQQYQPSIGAAKLELKPLKGARKFNVCKKHYKAIKKYKKKDDKILKPSKFQDGSNKFKQGRYQARLE